MLECRWFYIGLAFFQRFEKSLVPFIYTDGHVLPDLAVEVFYACVLPSIHFDTVVLITTSDVFGL